MNKYEITFTNESTKEVQGDTHDISNHILTIETGDQASFITFLNLVKHIEITPIID